MKIIDGEFFSASSKAFLKFDSDSPANLLIISGPLIRKKNAPVSFATARAIKVLPVRVNPKGYYPDSLYLIKSFARMEAIKSAKHYLFQVVHTEEYLLEAWLQ